jgi:hypothetical protein
MEFPVYARTEIYWSINNFSADLLVTPNTLIAKSPTFSFRLSNYKELKM